MTSSKPRVRVDSIRIPASDAEQIAGDLRSLAKTPRQPTSLTGAEVISRCLGEIEACQKVGYTLDEIAEVLAKKGLTISGASLSYHIRRAKEDSSPKRTRQPKKQTPSNPSS